MKAVARWASLPRHTPRVLLRHPLLLANYLGFNNAFRRGFLESGRAGVWVIAGACWSAVLIATIVSGRFSGWIGEAVQALLDYWVLTIIVAALYATTSVSKRRRHFDEQHARSWLIAAPISQGSLHWSHAIRSVGPIVGVFAIACAVILIRGLRDDAVDVGTLQLIGYIGVGLFAGALLGWLRERRRSHHRREDSRYIPRARQHAVPIPSDAGLAGWPVAQVFAWSRPENSRLLLLVALFAVQGGSSALHGLAVVALWLLASYLAGLLSAMCVVARAAAYWLRSTPISLHQLMWAVARRAMLHQSLGAALAVTLMTALGAPAKLALLQGFVWLALVVLVAGFALFRSGVGNARSMWLALWLTALAAIATTWQLRGDAKI